MGCAGQDSRRSVGQSRIGRIRFSLHGHQSKDAVGSWWRGEASRDSLQDRHRSAGRNSLARLGVCASLFLAGADALLAPSVNSVARPVQFLQRLRGGWGSVSWECESLGQLRPVPNVDLDRFMGTWHEIGRMDSGHQAGQVCNVGVYELQRDRNGSPKIQATMLYRRERDAGEVRRKPARAWPLAVAGCRNSVWWYTLLGGLVGFRFCIVGLDPAYRYAVAGNPGGQFLWLMSRSASAPAEVFRKLIAIAAANGFDVSPCLLSLEALPAAQPVYGDRI